MFDVTDELIDFSQPDVGSVGGISGFEEPERIVHKPRSGAPKGACCLPDGTCVDNITQDDCEGEGGIYRDDGSICDDIHCCPSDDTPITIVFSGIETCSSCFPSSGQSFRFDDLSVINTSFVIPSGSGGTWFSSLISLPATLFTAHDDCTGDHVDPGYKFQIQLNCTVDTGFELILYANSTAFVFFYGTGAEANGANIDNTLDCSGSVVAFPVGHLGSATISW